MERIDEIMKHMHEQMAENNIEPTNENILTWLLGTQDAWDEMDTPEDFDKAMEFMLFKLALANRINEMMLKQRFPEIWK